MVWWGLDKEETVLNWTWQTSSRCLVKVPVVFFECCWERIVFTHIRSQTAQLVLGHGQMAENGLQIRAIKASNKKLVKREQIIRCLQACMAKVIHSTVLCETWLKHKRTIPTEAGASVCGCIDGRRGRLCVRNMTYQFCDDVIAIREVLFKHEMKATVNKHGVNLQSNLAFTTRWQSTRSADQRIKEGLNLLEVTREIMHILKPL